ncbi:hypothetical protein CHM34_06235 [Paludifilum halophilum]|uniref:Uncharacterized protein n=1 Tax=Paludifilum halophilum TaxID=1642702 RepID=A0A235B7Y2_9BACL|nr:hypothetical protein CHM34_06235 [Paludifilum halophilum]
MGGISDKKIKRECVKEHDCRIGDRSAGRVFLPFLLVRNPFVVYNVEENGLRICRKEVRERGHEA